MRWFTWLKSEPSAASIEWSVRRALYDDARLRDADLEQRNGLCSKCSSGRFPAIG